MIAELSSLINASSPTPKGTTSGVVWQIMGVIAGGGAVGGVVNALLTGDGGIILPKLQSGIVRLGVVGNILLGAFAAVITWGLYGPLKDAVLMGTQPSGVVSATLTVTSLAGAALAGAGGARVISSEIDKRYLKQAAANAASGQPDAALAKTILTSTPAAAAVAAQGDAAQGDAAAH